MERLIDLRDLIGTRERLVERKSVTEAAQVSHYHLHTSHGASVEENCQRQSKRHIEADHADQNGPDGCAPLRLRPPLSLLALFFISEGMKQVHHLDALSNHLHAI